MDSFVHVLDCIRDGKEYFSLPPKGPTEELPSLSEEEIRALQSTVYGTNLDFNKYTYYSLEMVEDDYRPVAVGKPDLTLLENLNIYSIDGSNQRLSHPSFFFILARAALVKFKYTKDFTVTDVFTLKTRDLSGIVLVDGNIFKEEYKLYVNEVKKNEAGSADLLQVIKSGKNEPILTRYNPERDNKVPSSQALGMGVKFQQALEISLLDMIPTDEKSIVIRDGPLFSTSISPRDTLEGLSKTFTWHQQILVSVSKRIGESTFITELLLQKPNLRKLWFPGQTITDSTLKTLASDQLILTRILKPGYRTPLIKAVGRARSWIVQEEERLAPLACYYMRRESPNTVIRLEIPRFMWERSPQKVNEAISIVAWQLDLGVKAPYIQIKADELCQLNSEIELLRMQTSSKLFEKKIYLSEVYI